MRAVYSMPSAWISTGDLHHQRWHSLPMTRQPRCSLLVLTLFRCLMQLLVIFPMSRQSLSLVVTANTHRLLTSRQAAMQPIQVLSPHLVMWHFSCTQAAQRVGQKVSCSPTKTFLRSFHLLQKSGSSPTVRSTLLQCRSFTLAAAVGRLRVWHLAVSQSSSAMSTQRK